MHFPHYKNYIDFYKEKFHIHGANPEGVGWNSEKSQIIRFQQLLKIINEHENFSLNDLGCGYGALFDFMRPLYKNFSYFGYDISSDMIDSAESLHDGEIQGEEVSFHLADKPLHVADYGVTSGIFNAYFDLPDCNWEKIVEGILDELDATSKKGFAFNCLTKYSDLPKMKKDLYYADPCYWFDLCKRKYAKNVALLHDYDLYDFTMLIRK